MWTLLGEIIALISIGIVIWKMWNTFQTKLVEIRLDMELKIKGLEVSMETNKIAIMKCEESVANLHQQHKTDIKDISKIFQDQFEKQNKNNREDHGKLFNLLNVLNTNLSEMKGSFETYKELDQNGN